MIRNLQIGFLLSCFCISGFIVQLGVGLSTGTHAPRTSSSPSSWKPKVPSLEERRNLRGGVQHQSDVIGSIGFHHVEFYCGDARSTATQFAGSFGAAVALTRWSERPLY